MNFLKSKRRLLLALALVLIALFIFRPGANGLRHRITNSVGLALGRRVEVGHVSIRILPQPGFDLENFVVYDDPSFSAEPMLRAQEVTAVLRLRSLLGGRIEIARLSLKEPSFNLARNEAGHWNLESLLERAARTPAVPTNAPASRTRPVFPYIEADNGRINFKIGQEKKAYALTDADFALWLQSENQWGMRLAAQPVRTDYNLSDTGTIRVNGLWQRAGSLRETPLQFSFDWQGAQLGQLTKLIYGNDMGWRGGFNLAAKFSGMPADMKVELQAFLRDFRRYDIVSTDSLRLATQCSARYSSVEHLLSEIACQSPVKSGTISLAGNIAAPTGPRSYDLTFTAKQFPVVSLLALAKRSKKDIPADLTARGTLNGALSIRTQTGDPAAVEWKGSGEAAGLLVTSDSTKTSLELGSIPFEISSDSSDSTTTSGKHAPYPGEGPHVNFGPFSLAEGKPGLPAVRGSLTRAGYSISIQGDAPVQKMLRAAHAIGLAAPQFAADGAAKLDLQIAGQWPGFPAPTLTGSAQLHAVHAEMPGLNRPLEVTSAKLVFADRAVRLQNLSASTGHTLWTGSVDFPRQCPVGASCPIQFDLKADSVSFNDMNALLNPHLAKRPWYKFLSGGQRQSWVATINASGRISADHALLGTLNANHLSAHLEFAEGKARLTDFHADLLGGHHTGNWEANFRVSPPAYTGTGSFERVDLNQLPMGLQRALITGIGGVSYRFNIAGLNAKDLMGSAAGDVRFEMRDGTLPRIVLTGSNSPLHMREFTGQADFRKGAFAIREGKMETAGGTYQVSGTASLSQELDLKLARTRARGFTITGTLAEPRVSPISSTETQAALKQ